MYATETQVERGGETRLSRLTRSAEAAQWLPDDHFNWERPIRRPRLLSARDYGNLISQLYFGETATLAVCRRIADRVEDPEARAFLATQMADEARHAAVYDRYLSQLGHKTVMDDDLRIALESGLSWRGSISGLIVAYQILLESEALKFQQLLADRLPCPLLREINARIARDEARHVAFGKVYLRHHLAELPQEERFAIYRWVKRLWLDCAQASEARYGPLARAAIGLVREPWNERWHERHAMLQDLGLISEGERPPAN